jgi:ribosome biogenesis GTPase / thiamine phosphate phosphatase
LSRFAALDLGLVVAAHGRHLVVETPERQRIRCHLRGKKTEAVVGDRVRWQASGDAGVIEEVEPRSNLLFRQDEWKSKSFAANLDALLVLVAVEPPFSESQLARALVAASSAGVPAWIGLNKTDLPSADAARARLAPYLAMGIEVIEFALKADTDDARAKLLPRLAGRTTLVLGPSGMGKSTLINRFVPAADAQVGEISLALNAGKHTTTTTTWYWLGEDASQGALIDSPGFQEFGLRQIAATDLASLMPDFAVHLGQCKFYNCSHRHEPQCGVRDALQRGDIAATRYRIYGELFDELS